MPLRKGKRAIQANIRTLIHEGKSPEQAAAIAYKEAEKMAEGAFYIARSDQPGMRGKMSLRDAERELGKWQQSAPHDATLIIKREDGSTFKEYRYTMGDDNYEAWHVQELAEGGIVDDATEAVEEAPKAMGTFVYKFKDGAEQAIHAASDTPLGELLDELAQPILNIESITFHPDNPVARMGAGGVIGLGAVPAGALAAGGVIGMATPAAGLAEGGYAKGRALAGGNWEPIDGPNSGMAVRKEGGGPGSTAEEGSGHWAALYNGKVVGFGFATREGAEKRARKAKEEDERDEHGYDPMQEPDWIENPPQAPTFAEGAFAGDTDFLHHQKFLSADALAKSAHLKDEREHNFTTEQLIEKMDAGATLGDIHEAQHKFDDEGMHEGTALVENVGPGVPAIIGEEGPEAVIPLDDPEAVEVMAEAIEEGGAGAEEDTTAEAAEVVAIAAEETAHASAEVAEAAAEVAEAAADIVEDVTDVAEEVVEDATDVADEVVEEPETVVEPVEAAPEVSESVSDIPPRAKHWSQRPLRVGRRNR